MEFRLARMDGLPRIQAAFEGIVQDMNRRGIDIWDEVYPCAFFEEDIERRRLYVLLDRDQVASAFALCEGNEGEGSLGWENPGAKALYFDRFGVNASYAGRGTGGLMVEKAKETAKALGAEYLRLFVAVRNGPAIRLYQKCGLARVPGVYEEEIGEGCVLREYGFEAALP